MGDTMMMLLAEKETLTHVGYLAPLLFKAGIKMSFKPFGV